MNSIRARIRTDHVAAAGLLAVGYLAPQILRWMTHSPFPAGSDSELWSLSAYNMTVGAPSLVPPIFPGLAAIAHTLIGCHPLYALAWISAISVALLGPVGYALARTLGASPAAAALGGLAALLTPQLAVLGAKAQPDGLTALTLMFGIFAARWLLLSPGPRSLAAATAVAGLAPLLREHGLLISAGLAVAAVAAPGHPLKRIGRLLLLVAAVYLSPLLTLHSPALPWDNPWFARLAQVGEEMGATSLPSHAGGLPERMRAPLAELYENGQRGRIVLFHARWAIQQAPWLWVWIALALVAVTQRRHRLALLVGLAPVLPALVIWSAPRHVAVALPIATALWAAWFTRSRRRDMLIMGLGLGFLLASQLTWEAQLEDVRSQAHGNGDLHEVGEAICALAEPGDLATGEPRAFLFCPMPRHCPKRDGRGADWKVWMANGAELSPPWYSTGISNDQFEIYRLAPWLTGDDRPCNDVRPTDDVTYFATGCETTEMSSPCWAKPSLYPKPTPDIAESIQMRATAITSASARQTNQVEVSGLSGPLIWGSQETPPNPHPDELKRLQSPTGPQENPPQREPDNGGDKPPPAPITP